MLMPPRDPELPEGTDHIVNGASRSSGAAGSGGGTAGGGTSVTKTSRASSASEGGFVATGDSGSGGATDKLVSQVRDQVSTLRGQATDKLRGLADDGKGRATGLLDNFSEVINDAARSIDERLGEDYGRYAHQAADAVASFAGRVREKTIDDLLDDGRSAVRASPGIAIAAAAVAGFALMRVIRTGIEESSSGRSGGSRRTNKDTTAGGGA
ncbi:MAG TPA: hypothetical protein VFO69_09360 [Allosphingosinicella sp.]|nr:hypothetical protein [Allosphingosinicella sp.]